MVAHLTVNQRAAGSSPAPGAIASLKDMMIHLTDYSALFTLQGCFYQKTVIGVSFCAGGVNDVAFIFSDNILSVTFEGRMYRCCRLDEDALVGQCRKTLVVQASGNLKE